MQSLTRKNLEAIFDKLLVFCKGCAFQNLVAAIFPVVEQRMSDMLEMNPNLMSATCFETAFHKVYISKSLEHSPMSYSLLAIVAIRENVHNLAVLEITSHVANDCSLVFGHIAPH